MRYMKIKPGRVSDYDLNDQKDNRYQMDFDTLYEVIEEEYYDNYVRLKNPKSFTSHAPSFRVENLIGPYTKEENPEMFL